MDTVNIFVPGITEPVFKLSRLELAAKSRLFYDLFSSLNMCDGCVAELAVIIPGENRLTVEAVFSQAAHFNKKTSIFQDQAGYSALMRRLEFQGSYTPRQLASIPPEFSRPPDPHQTGESFENVTSKLTLLLICQFFVFPAFCS